MRVLKKDWHNLQTLLSKIDIPYYQKLQKKLTKPEKDALAAGFYANRQQVVHMHNEAAQNSNVDWRTLRKTEIAVLHNLPVLHVQKVLLEIGQSRCNVQDALGYEIVMYAHFVNSLFNCPYLKKHPTRIRFYQALLAHDKDMPQEILTKLTKQYKPKPLKCMPENSKSWSYIVDFVFD